MSNAPKTPRRWISSVIAASAEPMPSFPWMRAATATDAAAPAPRATDAATPRTASIAAR